MFYGAEFEEFPNVPDCSEIADVRIMPRENWSEFVACFCFSSDSTRPLMVTSTRVHERWKL